MAGELSWRDAITKVLQQAGSAMHYTDIADAITSSGLKTTLGATPAATVNSIISVSIDKDGKASPFVRVKRGEYTLRSIHLAADAPASPKADAGGSQLVDDEPQVEPSAIQALGMFWRRELVNWTTNPSLLGQQQRNSAVVDFCAQQGIYLLHDGRETVYVGRVTDQPLGRRLWQHTVDRLNGRWDRFSWFGIHRVTDAAKIEPQAHLSLTSSQIIVDLEAVLIESLEPPLNRRRGDGLRAVEYIQVEDPVFRQQQVLTLVNELQAKLLSK
jgi:hypothetical protein